VPGERVAAISGKTVAFRDGAALQDPGAVGGQLLAAAGG
jgi:hypothetical protein